MNSRTSKQSKALAAIRERFAAIASVANKGSYGSASTMDVLCEIERLWHEAEDIMLTDEVPPGEVTLGGNPPHMWTGVKW